MHPRILEDLQERAYGRVGNPCIDCNFREHHFAVMERLSKHCVHNIRSGDGKAANARKGKARGIYAPLGRATSIEAGSR